MIKFILLGYGRTGSTLLSLALREHYHVRMYEEIFNEAEEERRRSLLAGYRVCQTNGIGYQEEEGRSEFYRNGEDAARFVREEVFYERRCQEPLAVGFKIFYNQARQDRNAKKVWNYLIENKDIRVIHLTRNNLLECLLSLEIAFRTNEWTSPEGATVKRAQLPPFRLDPKTCESYFHELFVSREWAKLSFREHKTLSLEYEKDLCHDFQSTMTRVQDFLGVPRWHTEQPLAKQAKRTPREQISNYTELKEHFHCTLFEEFFV